MLTKKLTKEEQAELLGYLFGFTFDDGALINEDGAEFYGILSNAQFDFSTLEGIFLYTAYRAKNQGYKACQYQMRKALGV